MIAALERGGAERQMRLLVQGLDKKKYRTGILYIHGGTKEKEMAASSDLIKIQRGHKFSLAVFFGRVYRAVQEFAPDLVHLWMPEILTVPAAFAGRKLGVPVVSSHRGALRLNPLRGDSMRDVFKLFQHALCDQIICNYDVQRENRLFRRLFKLKNGVVVRNAVCADLARGEDMDFEPDSSRFNLVYAGRMDKLKCIPLLVKAVARLVSQGENIFLVLFLNGSHRQKRSILQLIDKLGIGGCVKVFDYENQWFTVAQKCDLFVFPSVSEGMSNVVLESMKMGLPVACARNFPTEQFSRHLHDIYMFDPMSVDAIAGAVMKLKSDKDLRSGLSERAKRTADRFDEATMVSSYESIYDGLLKTGSPSQCT